MNAVVSENICPEGVALRWDRGAISAIQKDILLLFVARSVTLNFECHKAYEVEHEGTKPYRGKAESDGEDRLSVTPKVTEPNHRLKLVNRLCSSGWLTA